MKCPAPDRLAAALDGGDPETARHASDCIACHRALAEQRAIRDLVRRVPAPVLSAGRRAGLAGEVMAHADRARSPRRIGALVAMAAAAAAIVLALVRGDVVARAPSAPSPASEPVALRVRGTSHELVPAEPRPVAAVAAPSSRLAQIAASGGAATMTRTTTPATDVVAIDEGALAIDAQASRPITVVARDTTVELHGARATITAHAGAIASIQVFAGSVEITAAGHRQVIEPGALWTPAPNSASMQAFRDGWTALRAQHHADAIAAFDRATDPVVAEDATFWAAIAAERAHDREDAVRRLTDFLARFPASPRAAAARDHLAGLH